MRLPILFFLWLLSTSLFAQEVDAALKATLDSIMLIDQSTRELLDPTISEARKSELLQTIGYTEEAFFANPWGIIHKNDLSNQQAVFQIIAEHGYPGKSLVGEPTNRAAWYVIQHSSEIEKYLPMIKQAGKEGEIPMTLVAMMEDRYLMNNKEAQIYGTQVYGGEVTDPETGEKRMVYIVWPIKDPETVNERRKAIGYTTTVEAYAARMDVAYEVFTLEQVKEMFDY